MEYSYHHPNTELKRSKTEGVGLFSKAPIAAGEVILVTGGRVLPFEMLASHELPGHPIQVEKDVILAPFDSKELDGIFVVNHSCTPNAGVRGNVSLVALRDIQAGEEICFDYVMTDSDPADQETFAMNCLCGSSECRGRITDRDWRREDLQARYRGYFSSYLQARIDAL